MRRTVVLLAVALAACGVPIESEPVIIDVEYEPPARVATTDAEGLVATQMFLVRSERLVPVTRDLPAGASPADVAGSLLDGPTLPEERSQLRTAIPVGTSLLGVEVVEGIAYVDLSREFASVGGEEEILAVAQIVLTLSAIEGVSAVGFLLDGVATNVPLPDGGLSEVPVTGEPYLALIGLAGPG